MTRILILTGHPRQDSLCAALATTYAEAAEAAGHEVHRLALADLPVDLAPPDYSQERQPEPWVARVQTDLLWCEHLVLVSPMWWGGPPAALKALFDRVLMPGFAFRYRPNSSLWDALLKGRSARVILTMDTPPLFFQLAYAAAYQRQLKNQILGFCGFRPVRFTALGVVRRSTDARRRMWLVRVRRLGAAGR